MYDKSLSCKLERYRSNKNPVRANLNFGCQSNRHNNMSNFSSFSSSPNDCRFTCALFRAYMKFAMHAVHASVCITNDGVKMVTGECSHCIKRYSSISAALESAPRPPRPEALRRLIPSAESSWAFIPSSFLSVALMIGPHVPSDDMMGNDMLYPTQV